ncbi:MAG: hypothetical protein HYU84_02075 [Chloroflexi bacterium]|nr:hypothetical protein [Chloroflexota bacterium]MBI3167449.1 hypothetical protein [Chloroflexota bacterium]
MQENRSQLPSTDRMGMLIASVLLTFALSRLIQSPGLTLSLSLPGFYYAFPLTLGSFLTLLAAALTAAGMDWLTRDHPSAEKRSPREHLLLPTLTAFVMGTPLAILSDSSAWWWGFIVGAVLLAAVCIAEYISIDPSAPSYGFARAGLTAVAYALFLILVTSLRFSGARMVLVIPSVLIVAGLISLRILHLDGTDRWDFPWAVGIGLVCAQIGAGLHYWPLSPVQFGLAVTGPLYALTMLSTSLTENIPLRRAMVGPIVVAGVAWIAAIFL